MLGYICTWHLVRRVDLLVCCSLHELNVLHVGRLWCIWRVLS